MQGEFFSWLSHDDSYLPTKIEHQMHALVDKQTILYGPYNVIDADSIKINRVKPHIQYSEADLNKPLYWQ